MSTEQGKKQTTIIVTGTSGSGKTTVAQALVSRGAGRVQFERPVTATDRAPRHDERDGVDYHFLTADAFAQRVDPALSGASLYERLEAGETCETILADASDPAFAEFALVYGQLKGVPIASLETVRDQGATPLLVVDPAGARTFQRTLGRDRVHTLFMRPTPASPEARTDADAVRVLSERIRQREPDLAPSEFEARVATALREIAWARAGGADRIVDNPTGQLDQVVASLQHWLERTLRSGRSSVR